MTEQEQAATPEETEPVTFEDGIQEEYSELNEKMEDLKAKREFFKSQIGAEVKNRLNEIFQDKINNALHQNGLIGTAPKDVTGNCGRIAAHQEAMQLIDGLAWDNEIEELVKELEDFAERNEMFMQHMDADKSGDAILVRFNETPSDDVVNHLETNGFVADHTDQFYHAESTPALEEFCDSLAQSQADIFEEWRHVQRR